MADFFLLHFLSPRPTLQLFIGTNDRMNPAFNVIEVYCTHPRQNSCTPFLIHIEIEWCMVLYPSSSSKLRLLKKYAPCTLTCRNYIMTLESYNLYISEKSMQCKAFVGGRLSSFDASRSYSKRLGQIQIVVKYLLLSFDDKC